MDYRQPIIHLTDAPALIASLPQQFGEDLPASALALLLLKSTGPAEWQVENMTVSMIEHFDPDTAITLTSGMTGVVAVAAVIDATAYYDGANGCEHALLLDAAAYHLRDRGTHLATGYAARAVAAGQPVWSVETDERLGIVPAPVQAPLLATYTLADALTRRPPAPLARLAD